jgi:predicted GIY-YIG superfamily endonuclease
MAFWCYILRCADGKYYTGHTDDLERRVAEHHHGGFCDFTSRRRPVELIWAADFPTRLEALECEMRVKKWSRAKKEALAAGDWNRLSYLARPPRERVSTSLDTNGGGLKDIETKGLTYPVRVERSRDTSGATSGGD